MKLPCVHSRMEQKVNILQVTKGRFSTGKEHRVLSKRKENAIIYCVMLDWSQNYQYKIIVFSICTNE
jgi:hypothetical protein